MNELERLQERCVGGVSIIINEHRHFIKHKKISLKKYLEKYDFEVSGQDFKKIKETNCFVVIQFYSNDFEHYAMTYHYDIVGAIKKAHDFLDRGDIV